jgi:hypothetical protein
MEKLKNILRNTTTLTVIRNKDGGYCVRQADGKIIANNLTNAEAWAIVDRSERRPPRSEDF